MNIVTCIVTPFVETLVKPVKNHLDYLIFCTKHVTEMRTKWDKLITTKSDVENHKDNNECNSLKVPATALVWLKKVRKIDTEVQTIPVDVNGLHLMNRHKHGKKASDIIKDIDDLMEEKSNIDWTDIPIALAEVNSTNASTSTPSSDYNDFESRKSVYTKAFNALKAENTCHMIALWGMGGVGKTTMMKKLKKDVIEKAMFGFILEVAIGENMDVSVIQQAVAEQLAIDLKESTKEARVSKLRNGFEEKSGHGKKKFLLILDDVWQSVDLNDIGLSPKPDQGIDFKVLLTSRKQDVCIQMGVELDSILNLEVIKPLEAQDLFHQLVKNSDDEDLDPNLRKVGDDIALRCHGLPIAISIIAPTLKGIKNMHEWENARDNLKDKNIDEALLQIFARSYKNILHEETRLTLLLCGLFPEDFDTPIEDLVRYGWGMKLFRNADTIRKARNRLNTCIGRLIRANLLIQSQEVGYVKMHDLVRSFVLHMCSEGEHASVVGNMSKWSTEPMSESCKRISLTCKDMHDFPTDLKYPNLSLLKLMHGDESLRIPEDFYEGMQKLEVVAFDKMKYPVHLRSLQCSANLRTLCLHQCSLMFDCSSIGNLLNLEVLSFAYSSIHKLPSAIVKLNKLKLLDLTNCWYLCIDNGILKSLVKLEELYMRGVRREVNAEGDELVECSKNFHALEIEYFDNDALPQNMSFKNLKTFRISLGCRLNEIGGQSRYSFENTLMLVTNESGLLDSRVNEFFEKTQVLYLQVNGIHDFGDGLGASLHNLRVLQISECTNLRYLFTIRVANNLKQLELLRIDKCPVLATLVDSDEIGEVEVITFPSLKFLSLYGLPMLMSLCKDGNIIELPQLEELELQKLPNITSIYQHFLKKEVMISKLKKLKILNMGKLKEIWPSQLSNNDQVISQLRVIEVEGCDSLVNLFPSNPMSLLHHLEQLTIWGCGSIDVIFNIDLGSSSFVGEIEEGSSSSNLRSIEVKSCGEVREVWRVKGENNDLPILGFQNVEFIEIKGCKSLRKVFTPTTSNFDMKALTKIILDGTDVWEENESSQVEKINVVAFPSYLIHTCRYLRTLDISQFKREEAVFEIEIPNNRQQPLLPHLKDLNIYDMERMTHVWKYDRNQFLISQQKPISSSFPNLASIELISCNRIKYLFSPLMAKLLSNLNSITIFGCDAIEEVVSNIADEYEEIATSISSQTNTTFFPHLDGLYLYNLKSLKRIDGVGSNRLTSVTATSVQDKFQCSQLGVTYSSFCRYLKTIYIYGCDALLNVIPSHAVGRLPELEMLKISDCNSLREIFEIEEVNKDDIGKGNGDIGSAITIIPRLIELPNLKVLHIKGCPCLKYIFTSSILESLKKLEELEIRNCDELQVIVKQEDNGLIESEEVVFHRLKSLTLVRLEKLKSFFSGKNNFQWTSLDKVEIYGCPKMMIFTSGVSKTPNLKYINTGFGKHSLECGLNFDWTDDAPHENQLYNSSMCSTSEYLQFPWSFSNLIELYVNIFHVLGEKKTIFPSNELVKVENLGDIEEADKVFEGRNDETQSADDVILISKKKQVMSMDPPTSSCIWKIHSSNLSNLTMLSLNHCYYLEHVFSYGMAATLVKLQDLHISACEALKVIVEQVHESETKANEVASFPCLKSLLLTNLRSLKGFCLESDQAFQWPSLHTLKIKNCQEMTVFTHGQSITPKVKVIETSFGWYEGTEDINSFVRTKIQEGYIF